MAAADWPTDRKMLYLHSGEKHDYALRLAKLFSGFAQTFATLAQEMDDRELRRPALATATGKNGNFSFRLSLLCRPNRNNLANPSNSAAVSDAEMSHLLI